MGKMIALGVVGHRVQGASCDPGASLPKTLRLFQLAIVFCWRLSLQRVFLVYGSHLLEPFPPCLFTVGKTKRGKSTVIGYSDFFLFWLFFVDFLTV